VSQDEKKTVVEGPKDGKLRGVDYNMGGKLFFTSP
jgi:hypothetical protein